MMVITKRIKAFWFKVDKQGPYPHKKACELYPEIKGTRCWLWTGCVDRDGYGLCNLNNKTERAHRVAWILKNGKISKGKKVLHKCDMPGCMHHLFLGTSLTNNRDRKYKGRNGNLSGELSPTPKLKDAQVRLIRKLYSAGGYTHQDLGSMYGVHRATISYVIARKTFRHI